MRKVKRVKKRYLFAISSITLAITSVILLRTFDINLYAKKEIVENELQAITAFNKDFLSMDMTGLTEDEKAKNIRDNFSNKISYKKLFDTNEDFKNFKYLPNKKIYGFQMLNNAHVGFYHNSDDCGKFLERKEHCAGVIIDTNGYTRPNRFGRDQFIFRLYKDKITE